MRVISHFCFPHVLSLKPNNQVRNLVVILESDLNFNSHIKSITSAAFYHLKNVARIKGIVSEPDLERRIDFKTVLLVYKSLHGPAPKYISDTLEPYEPTWTLRTSGRGLLLVPRVSTKQGEAVFQVYAPKISLPEDVRQASTLTMFKSRLKTVLFSCAYDN